MTITKAEPYYWRSHMLDNQRVAVSTSHDSEAGLFCWDVASIFDLPNDNISLDDLEGAGPVGRKLAAAVKNGVSFTAHSLGLPIGRISSGFFPVLEEDHNVNDAVIT